MLQNQLNKIKWIVWASKKKLEALVTAFKMFLLVSVNFLLVSAVTAASVYLIYNSPKQEELPQYSPVTSSASRGPASLLYSSSGKPYSQNTKNSYSESSSVESPYRISSGGSSGSTSDFISNSEGNRESSSSSQVASSSGFAGTIDKPKEITEKASTLSVSGGGGVVQSATTDGGTTESDAESSSGSGSSTDTSTPADPDTYTTFSAEGSGTIADPYGIYTPSQIISIGNNPSSWDKHFVLNRDVDLSGITGNHPMIGDGGVLNSSIKAFTGSFDGGGNTITGFRYVDLASTKPIGFFGQIEAANVVNLNLSAVEIRGNDYVGGLVGLVKGGVVYNSSVSGEVEGDQFVGGAVGYLEEGLLLNTRSGSDVVGVTATGGLVGHVYLARVVSSKATGSVDGNTKSGGLVGQVDQQSNINNSYATGAVNGTGDMTGGLVGYCFGCRGVYYSYATGNVTGTTNVGGLWGYNSGGAQFYHSFTTSVVTGTGGAASVGPLRGNGLAATMTHLYIFAGSSCDSDSGTAGVQACNATYTGARALVTDFYSNALEPISSWDLSGAADGSNDYWASTITFPELWWEVDGWDSFTAPFAGDGTRDFPYLIATKEGYNLIGDNPRWMGRHFKLTANLDFNSFSYTQIASRFTGFFGSFDGDGRTISDVSLSTTTADYQGIFGIVVGEGSVKNLNISNIQISVTSQISGGLVGSLGGDVENVTVSGDLSTSQVAGGIAGRMTAGSITKCTNSLNVTQNSTSGGNGGVVGVMAGGVLSRCSNSGTIAGGAGGRAGGIVGDIFEASTVTDVFNTGNISGASGVGGVAGYLRSDCALRRAYSSGDVTGSGNYVGGAAGNAAGLVADVFSVGNILGVGSSADVGILFGLVGGGGTKTNNYYLTTSACDADSGTGGVQACNTTSNGSRVNLPDFYLSTNAPVSAWDFQDVWEENPGALPTLK